MLTPDRAILCGFEIRTYDFPLVPAGRKPSEIPEKIIDQASSGLF
jgi:hypothetical protein